MATKRADIYEFLRSQGAPSRLPGPWHRLDCDPSFFDLPDEPALLLDKLLKAFGRKELIGAKLINADGSSSATLADFAQARSYIAALQKGPDTKPFDLMAGEHRSVAGAWPWHAALSDYRVQHQVKSFGSQLLIAMSAADVAVLRSIGLPAVPADGLSNFGGDRLKQFSRTLRLQSEGSPEPKPSDDDADGNSGRPLAMVLANWSPAGLSLADVP